MTPRRTVFRVAIWEMVFLHDLRSEGFGARGFSLGLGHMISMAYNQVNQSSSWVQYTATQIVACLPRRVSVQREQLTYEWTSPGSRAFVQKLFSYDNQKKPSLENQHQEGDAQEHRRKQ